MSLLQTIKCDVEGCDKEHTEEKYGVGHMGWGHVAGVENIETGAMQAYTCPEHLKIIKEFISTGRR